MLDEGALGHVIANFAAHNNRVHARASGKPTKPPLVLQHQAACQDCIVLPFKSKSGSGHVVEQEVGVCSPREINLSFAAASIAFVAVAQSLRFKLDTSWTPEPIDRMSSSRATNRSDLAPDRACSDNKFLLHTKRRCRDFACMRRLLVGPLCTCSGRKHYKCYCEPHHFEGLFGLNNASAR